MRKIKVLSIILASSFLMGCSDSGMEDLFEYIAKEKSKPPKAIPPIPQQKEVRNIVFNIGLKEYRDPFSVKQIDSKAIKSKKGGVSPDSDRIKEELESFSLDALTMVGVVDLNEIKYGLIKTSNGKVHTVKKGNYMGENYGKIIDILDNKIILNELHSNEKIGEWKNLNVSILLDEVLD